MASHEAEGGGGNIRRSSLLWSHLSSVNTSSIELCIKSRQQQTVKLWSEVWDGDTCSLPHLAGAGVSVFQEVNSEAALLTSASRQLICFIYPSSWWFIRWQTLLSMNRDKRHSDSCLWRLIKTLPRIQWGGNFTPWSPTKCRWQSILAQVPSSGNIPIMGTRKWLTRTLACFRPETCLSRCIYLYI